MSAAQILLLIAVAVAAVLVRVAVLFIRPYKACPTCSGRGHCIRCGYKGKVLRLGARLVHPELRKNR